MLKRLEVDFELREIDLSDKPDEFLNLSPTGKVPMLVEDDVVLYESQIINDYLVELFGWEGAYPGDLRLEYRQKVAMKQWDSVILEPFYEGLSDPGVLLDVEGTVKRELSQLASVVRDVDGATDNLFAFHFGPFWARMSWLEKHSVFPGWVREQNGLGDWMDRILEEPPIAGTLPDPEWTVEQYEENYVEA